MNPYFSSKNIILRGGNVNTVISDEFDYRDVEMTVDEKSADIFLDTIMDAAKLIPFHVFMSERERSENPIVDLAYKLYCDKIER